MNRRNFIGGAVLPFLPLRMFNFGEDDAWRDQVWTTREGREVRLRDMTDDHLRNTIFYLVRRNGQLDSWYRYKNGSLDSIQTVVTYPERRWPIYASLIREAEHRRLSWTRTTPS